MVSLPHSLSLPHRIDSVIKALEEDNHERGLDPWQNSFWLKGELFLVLDADYNARVGIRDKEFKLHYSSEFGLNEVSAADEG